MKKTNVLFLGAGKMGASILRGLIHGGYPEHYLGFHQRTKSSALALEEETGAQYFVDLQEGLEWANVIIVGVKPHIFHSDLKHQLSTLGGSCLIVSIMAGITLKTLKETFGGDHRVIRTMPNLPLSVGEGATSVSSDGIDKEDLDLVLELFNSCGSAVAVTESLLNAATGLAGSGPAWVFEFIEGLVQGGVRKGLPRDVSEKLTSQLIRGSVELWDKSKSHPSALTAQVCSPGGTTITGLAELERQAFRSVVSSAVVASCEKADELGKS
jgi:pyrroline-5-carboxylate reductase